MTDLATGPTAVTDALPRRLRRSPAEHVRERVLQLHSELSRLDSLAPGPGVDPLFRELVQVCVRTAEPVARAVLAEPCVRAIRPELVSICSDGESRLEALWAERVLAAADPLQTLEAFPYLDNYRQLTRMEVHALAGAGHRPRPGRGLCFLGGGPLPLSALLLHQELAGPVVVVDRDVRAAELAAGVLARLAPGADLRVQVADASRPGDLAGALAGCDVVLVAALVGRSRPEKRQVLASVGQAMEPGGYLLARSAHGLRSLLYPVADVEDLSAAIGFAPQVLVHPLGDVVNSALVARREPGPEPARRATAPASAG